jgi:hypothetical protein
MAKTNLSFTCISWQAETCRGALRVRFVGRVRFCIAIERASSMADVKLREIVEEPEYLQKPKDDGNDYDGIEDSFDLSLHRDKAIDEPQQDANDDKGENQSDKGHLLFSNRNTEADWFSLIQWDAVCLDLCCIAQGP